VKVVGGVAVVIIVAGAGIVTARNDLAALKTTSRTITDSLGVVSQAIVSDRVRSDRILDLLVPIARLQCRGDRNAAEGAGLPCDDLQTPIPRR
jgi:hypothetical protein